MEKQNQIDAIIVGAGISGAAIAYELGKIGYRVMVVDKLLAAGHGSTANTCAIIRTHYSTIEGTAIAYDGYFYWKDWENYINVNDEMGYAVFKDVGAIVIKPKTFDVNKYLSIHDKLEIPYKVWDYDKFHEIMPHMVIDSFYPPKRPDNPEFENPPTDKINPSVIYFPASGYINDPILSVHNLQRAAEATGTKFLFNAEVTEIRKDKNRVLGITLKDGRKYNAPIVVNAAGPHSFVINRMAGIEEQLKIKTRALRHEVHFIPSPKNFSYEKFGMVVSDGDAGGYHRPETGNMILIGSEDPACDPMEWVEDPNNFDRNITKEQYEAQVFRLAKRIPQLSIPNKPKGIVDLYDVTDDFIPIYDRSDLNGFYLAIGTSGNQYKNGPVVGQILAKLIDACENGHDHDNDPVLVNLRNIDFAVNTGIFSRNRDVIKESTFSVLG